MIRASLYDLVWQGIDDAIVRGLRRAGRAVPEDAIGRTCHIANQCTREQIRDALARLGRRGLIREVEARCEDPDRPLMGKLVSRAYVLTEVAR